MYNSKVSTINPVRIMTFLLTSLVTQFTSRWCMSNNKNLTIAMYAIFHMENFKLRDSINTFLDVFLIFCGWCLILSFFGWFWIMSFLEHESVGVNSWGPRSFKVYLYKAIWQVECYMYFSVRQWASKIPSLEKMMQDNG